MKLNNDMFMLVDLRIPFVDKSTIFREDHTRKVYNPFLGYDAILGSNVYYFHRKLDGTGVQISYNLVHDLNKIISNQLIKTKQDGEVNLRDTDINTKTKIELILEDIKNGFIYINGSKIVIDEYEPDGEYFVLHSKNEEINSPIVINGVKKYYSIIQGQYVIFRSNGIIESFDNISSVSMSKDVRLDYDDIKVLWSK